MINAIQHLKMAAEDYRRMSTPNANTITEYTANKNAELADEFELAAEALRKLHNEGFNEGVLAGLKSLAESCRARREKQVPNALGNRRAAFGASVLTDVLCGNGTEVGAGGTAKG